MPSLPDDVRAETIRPALASVLSCRKATWSATVDAANGTSPDGRWRAYDYAELIARDKASLDIFWLKDDALADSDNLPPPDVIAQEIVDDLEAALEQFRLIAGDLQAAAQ